MARELVFAFNGSLVSSTISRILIDLNYSIGHRHLFSAAMRAAAATIHDAIVAQYYWPYRAEGEPLAGKILSTGRRVIHISSHSFTPEMDGKVQRADVGFLYAQRIACRSVLIDSLRETGATSMQSGPHMGFMFDAALNS
jgi:predicted N-formylglutamate amidohydrolase